MTETKKDLIEAGNFDWLISWGLTALQAEQADFFEENVQKRFKTTKRQRPGRRAP
jgi:hypothetical protein